MYSGLSENNAEAQFSFRLKAEAAEVRRLQKAERYHQICLALCELSKEFESLRKAFFEQGLSDSATVSMTISSKNIYPQYFELQNVFSMDKLAFGSINKRQCFAPTFIFDEPTNERKEHEVFEQYLHEQRDLEDIGSNMLICFEHDRECFTVCFPDIIMRTDESTARSINRVIDIRVSYAAIRGVIVSMETTQSNEIKATFTFQLNHPPTLLVYQMYDEQKGFKPPQRFLTWNPGYDVQNAMSNASCLVASCRFIDARILLDCFDRLRKCNNYAIEFRFLHRKELKNIRFYGRDPFANPNHLPPKYSKLKEPKYFPLVYAVQALISRGGELFDYFFRPEYLKFYEFLDTVVECYDEDFSTNPGATEVTDDLAREGYMRVRKIIVTPTRKLFINPELIMGNRSLRKEGDNMLRIIFRDDDNNKIYALPYKLISKTVAHTLTNPLHIGSREFHYLCSSNSQLRDHGCYFLAGSKDYVTEFRRSCGRIDSKSIPRIMSRLGQCFTQSRPLGIKVERGSYSGIFDYTGGNDSNGNPYIFSDGCGMISREFGQKIVKDMNLGDCLPSCFQIRFRGFKGVVAVNTLLDETKIWAQKHNRVSAFQKDALLPWYCQALLFRPSQKKFRGPRSEPVEIVKFSTPISLSLNKPLINILDQVSEMHGPEQHKRMCNRIFELMEYHLESTISSLVDKSNAFVTLNEFPQYILYDRLYDFDVTEEPFFRSLLRSAALSSLYRLVDKMKIRIPTSQGRMMFGIFLDLLFHYD
uniref:RNA-dependent RNA polymerase n=1 Tax=Panagrolaimus sp. PS1159 TaxID=55785 RepID=A0AC35EW18_9BILA